jgi:putative addiction module component (TIGR02574 family)
MIATLEEIRAAALRLTEEERGELAEMLWDSLDDEKGPRFSTDGMTDEEFNEELNRRAEEARNDPSASMSWEEVKALL